MSGEPVALLFRHPTTILVAGPTGCGKTEWLVQLLQKRAITPFPQRIIWVFGEWQNAYDRILQLDLDHKVQFVNGFKEELYDTLNPNVRNMMVLDDQMENEVMHKNGGRGLARFFTQGSHHRNLTVVYIVQNLFHQSGAMRTVSLNSHYIVLFKNPRDKQQVRVLSSQMYPNNRNFLVAAYEDATSTPFGYLVVDLRPDTADDLRARTHVFEPHKQVIYVPQPKESV